MIRLLKFEQVVAAILKSLIISNFQLLIMSEINGSRASLNAGNDGYDDDTGS